MGVIKRIELTEADRAELERIVAAVSSEVRMVERARIVLLAMASKTRNRFDLIRFLDMLDEEIPIVDGQQIVAITDNLSTRGTPEVQDWLKAHPRWRFLGLRG